jgi:cyclopropane fatty-acyl-phospholipid synthase-like methyltransferase
MRELPKHLGGHYNVNHVDFGVLEYLNNEFNVKSLLDVGCGLGEMKFLCDRLDMTYLGIDGDYTAERKHENIKIHDYSKGVSSLESLYDLGWSTEFLEHVEEKHVDNYMEDFKSCKHAMVTHALPGKPGWHHVNCKVSKYWVNVFKSHGFTYLPNITEKVREKSTMEREFIREQGLFFVNESFS